MSRLLSKQRYRDLLLGLGLLVAAGAWCCGPTRPWRRPGDGLALCGNVIIPSLFPFFVLSSLVVELGMSRYLGRLLQPVMAPLFRVNGACAAALALGFVGGYPVGARTAISLCIKAASAPKRRPSGCWPSATTAAPPSFWVWWGRESSAAGWAGCSSTWGTLPPRCLWGSCSASISPGRGRGGDGNLRSSFRPPASPPPSPGRSPERSSPP